MHGRLERILDEVSGGDGRIVVLTGAGISVESGIPTFRGPEGFWTVGSRNYRPEELATWDAFSRAPATIWPWYLYRLTTCREAAPNPGHEALVALESGLQDRFLLITQNVDGLHGRAGQSAERTYAIHGRIDRMRCSEVPSHPIVPVPDELLRRGDDRELTAAEVARLRCPIDGHWMRPHVLWFDEYYDEELYYYESSQRAVAGADLLLVVGTSGATNLPLLLAGLAENVGAYIVDVNPAGNPFSGRADRYERGFSWAASASEALPPIVARLLGR